MVTLLAGFGIALLVSMPPGANTALCVSRARGGAWNAAPVVVSAAAVDSIYAVLAATGLVAAAGAINSTLLHQLAAVFCLTAAIFLWRSSRSGLSARSVIGLAALNPGTMALWLGLSALAVAQPQGVGLLYWVVGVAAGTTVWFSAIAIASARLQQLLAPQHQVTVQRAFAAALCLPAVLLFA